MSETLTIRTPFGDLAVSWEDEALVGITFGPYVRNDFTACVVSGTGPRDDGTVQGVIDYFAGDRDALARLARVPAGTDFQMAVWQATLEVPFGETRSYGDVADRLGRDRGVSRAVGVALGQNPLPLIVPCHRVVGANGDLTGFGGGLGWKRALLGFEVPQFSLAL